MNTHLPQFDQIDPSKIEKQLDEILTYNRKETGILLNNKQDHSWDTLMEPLEAMDDQLNQFWSPIYHLHSVLSSDALRKNYSVCLPKLSEYATEMGQNKKLFDAICSLKNSKQFEHFNKAQKKVIRDSLRDFHLSGVDLPSDKKQQFAKIKKQLSKLCNQFEENLLDATQGWHYLVTQEKELAGLPEHALSLAKQAAAQKKMQGWLLTLEAPSFIAVMTYADSAKLREKIYAAYVTRASSEGENAGKWNNDSVIEEILVLRLELAKLLGFKNYAEYSLATKMAKTPEQVVNFLNDLASASLNKAKEEFKQLCDFAKQEFGINDLNPWDIAYYSEKLRKEKYDISQEDLRPYFPEDHVLSGLFNIVNKLYGIQINELKNINTWHKDVRFFEIKDQGNQVQGQFYLDLYARNNKRGGAWMDDCINRRKQKDGSIQIPVAYLTCNFNPPVGKEPAIFTHDEVLTLFHEFGHGLQHMLTTVDYTDVSGINGIPWDAVEIASQFMESWCFEQEAVDLFSQHYKTKKPLPNELFKKLQKAKHFQSAMQMVRQLEFSLFDFKLHQATKPQNKSDVQKTLDDIRKAISVTPQVDYNRFQNSFSHIFAGGYAAGYYSYKWAEVLACDAFSKFEENGIFDAKTGEEFLHCILETGGTEEPDVLFEQFRGRPYTIDALLKQTGIQET